MDADATGDGRGGVWRWAAVLFGVGLIGVTHWPGLNIKRFEPWPLDHLRLFAAYGLLALLLIRSRPASRSGLWTGLIALLGAGALVVIDEVTQPMAGRVGSMSHAMAGLVGIAVAGLAWRWRARSAEGEAIWLMRGVLVLLLVFFAVRSFDRGVAVPIWIANLPRFGIEQKTDKFAHFYAAMFIAIAALTAMPLGRRRFWLNVVLLPAVLIGVQPIVEIVQRRYGRRVEVEDVIAHGLGVVVGLAIWLIVRFVLKRLVLSRLGRAERGAA